MRNPALNHLELSEASDDSQSLNRTERKKREKFRAIKRAARELFAHKGFEATRTREIAERADIGAGTLFLYVSSKEELLVEIFLEELGPALDVAFASMPVDAPLLDQLLHIFNSIVRYHERDLGLARVFVREMTFVEERLKARMRTFLRSWYSRMATVIEAAQVRGQFSADVPALMLARNCFAIYIFTLRSWLNSDYPRARCEDWLRDSIGLHLRCALPTDGRTRVSATPK